MINLLPDDAKKEVRAARMNVVLLRYNLLTLGALALLLTLCLGFYILLHANQSSAVTTTSDNSVKAASYNDVRKQADDYRTNLSIAKKILNNEVNYTSVVFEITKLLPSGVILDNVTLSAADFGNQTTFTAHAKSYDAAAKLKSNFQSSSLFSNVFFQNLTDNSQVANSKATDYPLAVTIGVTLKKVEQ